MAKARKTTKKPTTKSKPRSNLTARLKREVYDLVNLTVDQRRHIRKLECGYTDFEAVLRAARQWHYTAVRVEVDEAILQLSDVSKDMSDDERREWLDDYLRGTVDQHSHIMETRKAWMVLAASDNCDAYADDFGEASARCAAIEQRALWAFTADAHELLDARSNEWQRPKGNGAEVRP